MVTRKLQATLRGRNVLLNIFEMWIALAGVISLIVYFYDPASINHNALEQTIGHNLTALFNIAYGLSGLTIFYGLLKPTPRWEVVGLFILGATTAVNGFAILGIFGLRGVATASTLLALTIAAWLRASFVLRTALRLVDENHAAG